MFTEAEKYFTPERRQMVREAIARAEKMTSGEIRVCIEDKSPEDMLDHAAYLFEKTGMHKTALRNGVLIYIAFAQRQIAVIGDAGINKLAGAEFWEKVKDNMISAIHSGNPETGLCLGIELCGQELAKHFPYQKGDLNELSDNIIFGTDEKDK